MSWYTATVNDNRDPEKRARLRLVIGGLTGSAVYPGWVVPMLPGGAAKGAAGLVWVPPVGSIVLVLQTGPEAVRWCFGPMEGDAKLPASLTDDYPNTAGFTSPSGNVAITAGRTNARVLVPTGGEVRLGDADASQAAVRGDALIGLLQPAAQEISTIFAGFGISAPNTLALANGLLPEATGGASGVYLSRKVKVGG